MTADPLTPSEEARLREVSARLNEAYHAAPLGNKADPLDELIYIQLSIRTREGAYTETFERLKDACGGEWRRLRELPEEQVLSILESGGMASVKLDRLLEQLQALEERFGEVTLAPLADMATARAESFLVSLPGVGPKTARCVLLYSLNRQVFPVDSHCLRVLKRLAFVPETLGRKSAHDVIQDLIPVDLRHDLHVNLVHHGRSLCIPDYPRCELCPLLELCPTGQAEVRS